MPKFVEQAATYGYDKTSTYIDTACEKIPLLGGVVKRLVPYAKPSVELADRIVDTVLELAAKPKDLVQGTASSVSAKVVHCKEVVVTKIEDARDLASVKVSQCKESATEALQKYRSVAAEKRSAILQMLQEFKGSAIEKSSNMLHAAATRLHLIGLWDSAIEMAVRKRSAGKSYVMGLKDMAYQKGNAGKKHVIVVLETVAGKAYSVAGKVVGKTRVDYVLGMVVKYTPTKIQTIVKAINGNSGSEEEMVEKKPVGACEETMEKQTSADSDVVEINGTPPVKDTSVKKINATSHAKKTHMKHTNDISGPELEVAEKKTITKKHSAHSPSHKHEVEKKSK